MNDLVVYTIYQNPLDYPGRIVVRRSVISGGVLVDPEPFALVDTLDQARALLFDNPNLSMFTRSDEDEPQIVETWLGVE